jgi:hypothetical protein
MKVVIFVDEKACYCEYESISADYNLTIGSIKALGRGSLQLKFC